MICLLISISTFSQRKKLEADAKGYLYCECIRLEYNAFDNNSNAAYNADFSGSYFVQMTNLSMQAMDSLYLYYKTNISNYRGIPQESSSKIIANMACYSCWKLCEAKDTRKYIKRVIKTTNK